MLLLTEDPDRAEALGADVIEPGVFEMTVATTDLTDTHGVTNELARPRR